MQLLEHDPTHPSTLSPSVREKQTSKQTNSIRIIVCVCVCESEREREGGLITGSAFGAETGALGEGATEFAKA